MARSTESGRNLDISDLNELYKNYFRYRANWYDVGLTLGIDYFDLQVIKQDNHHICEDCFREMLSMWLRKATQGTPRVKCDLDKAIKEVISRRSSQKTLTAMVVPKVIIVLMFLGAALWPAWESPITKAAEILRDIYRNSQVVQFDLLQSDSHDNMPVLDVIVKDRQHGGYELTFSEMLHNYTSSSGHLLITGQPGSGKTTLMRHLAKEWAKGSALMSCQIYF